MRIRSIKPEFFRDPDTTGRWPADLKIFYVGMWMVADDDGRFAWDAELIAADLFPFDRNADVEALLARLVGAGVLVQYEAEGRKYGLIRNFAKHQKINRKTESKITESSRSPHGGLTESSLSPHGGLTAGREGKGREGIREEECTEPAHAVSAHCTAPAASPVVAVLPCAGEGAHDYAVTQAQVDEWAAAYPALDVRAEVLKARAWLDANPTKRKTQSGVPRFLVSWLGRAQDGARSTPATRPKATAPAEVHTVTGRIAL